MKSFSSRQLDNFNVAHNHVEGVFELPRSSKTEIVTKCKGKICCEFSLQYHRVNQDDDVKNRIDYSYKLTMASPSSKQIAAASSGSKEIICAVVACTSDQRQSCGKRFTSSSNENVVVSSLKFTDIRIKMVVEVETSHHDYLIMPTNLNNALLPLNIRNFKFTRSSAYTVNRWA